LRTCLDSFFFASALSIKIHQHDASASIGKKELNLQQDKSKRRQCLKNTERKAATSLNTQFLNIAAII
jgi:hypothetical protein